MSRRYQFLNELICSVESVVGLLSVPDTLPTSKIGGKSMRNAGKLYRAEEMKVGETKKQSWLIPKKDIVRCRLINKWAATVGKEFKYLNDMTIRRIK